MRSPLRTGMTGANSPRGAASGPSVQCSIVESQSSAKLRLIVCRSTDCIALHLGAWMCVAASVRTSGNCVWNPDARRRILPSSAGYIGPISVAWNAASAIQRSWFWRGSRTPSMFRPPSCWKNPHAVARHVRGLIRDRHAGRPADRAGPPEALRSLPGLVPGWPRTQDTRSISHSNRPAVFTLVARSRLAQT
ncbi:MAG: hypothetical protein JWM36_3809 [Hyphomicrobiales bacterium]|nr:hypothetical protein [Hyphomicrobiales bacterium]